MNRNQELQLAKKAGFAKQDRAKPLMVVAAKHAARVGTKRAVKQTFGKGIAADIICLLARKLINKL